MKPIWETQSAVYRKMEREAYRVLHANTMRHKEDHLANFCITAQAMRDFFLEGQGIAPQTPEAQGWHTAWSSKPALVAVADIANLAKHFRLRDRRTATPRQPRTRQLARGQGSVVDVFVHPHGGLRHEARASPEMWLTLSDGTRQDLWQFLSEVLAYWRNILRSNGVNVRRQSLRMLLDGRGRPAGEG